MYVGVPAGGQLLGSATLFARLASLTAMGEAALSVRSGRMVEKSLNCMMNSCSCAELAELAELAGAVAVCCCCLLLLCGSWR